MITALRAEFRKLLTVRSTYFLSLAVFAIGAALIGFWIYGFKDVGHAAIKSDALFGSILAAVSVTGVFMSFVAVLLVGHEYRYNTIMYSLTSSNRRSKVFFAKVIAAAVVALVITLVIVAVTIALFYIGQHAEGIHTMAQQVPLWPAIWHSGATILGDVFYAFIISILVRSLIGAIAIVLILPTTVENLLELLLHDNVKYLPYTALGYLTNVTSKTSFTSSLVVVTGYVVVFGIAALVMFSRRDAN